MRITIGKKLAEGGCSEVFEWGGDRTKIVKLAKPNTDLYSLKNELHHTRIAWELGLPVPQAYELVSVEGRNGIVFERVDGESLMERFIQLIIEEQKGPPDTSDSDGFEDIRMTANLLHLVHSQTPEDMPDQRESIKRDIWRAPFLADSEKTAVCATLDRLPEKRWFCHGDPNPGNIVLRAGQPVLIDWNNATVGNPEADLAEYVVMMRFAVLPPDFPAEAAAFFNGIREPIIAAFVAEYERQSGLSYADIEPWLLPIAARKLSADSVGEEERGYLIKEIRRQLKLTE